MASSVLGLALLLGLVACDQAPVEGKPPVEGKSATAPAVSNDAPVIVPTDAPTPVVAAEPAAVPVDAAEPTDVATPPPEPAAVADPPANPPKGAASPSGGSHKDSKKDDPPAVKAFTDCQHDETYADGHCYASHDAACKALRCTGECLSLKSMPGQAKCV